MKRTLLAIPLLLCATAHAQGAVVLLDPARGGAETGGRIADRVLEKQVTLDLAGRLGSMLRARGFTVAMTREADTDTTNDARAALANTTHPIACILLHATATGVGLHLYTTSLPQSTADASSPQLWDQAQAAYANQSALLAKELQTAFARSRIPVSMGKTWMRPLDNMQCAAVAVEVSPQKDGTGANDNAYQARIADVIAGAMIFWRGNQPAPAVTAPAGAQP